MRYLSNHSLYKDRRRELRNNATPHEELLWHYIRNEKLGYKFRRQHSIGHYILDFYCRDKHLAIELDGIQHVKNREYDIERSNFLLSQNIRIIRFWNYEVEQSIESVIQKIQQELN